MSDLLSVYEDYLKIEKRASANTVSSYLRDVHQFAAAMGNKGVELAQVVTQEVEDYANSLVKRGKSPATVTRSVASIKSFYSCLMGKGYVSVNPAKGSPRPRWSASCPRCSPARRWSCFWSSPSAPT